MGKSVGSPKLELHKSIKSIVVKAVNCMKVASFRFLKQKIFPDYRCKGTICAYIPTVLILNLIALRRSEIGLKVPSGQLKNTSFRYKKLRPKAGKMAKKKKKKHL